MVWSAVTGSYGHYAVFQPLGPSFAGHGTSHRPVFNDGGMICDFMILMALTGAVSIVRRRQWAYLPVLLFVSLYAVYYIFFVAGVFSWYLAPFVAMTIFLCARGMQAVGALLRPPKLRTGAWTLFAAAYLSIFAAVLPYTFSTEKLIQERVENNVRKQVGIFLGHVMEKNEVVGTEPLGYVGYYSRRIVYDWPGLCSRKVVEFSRSHPREQRSLLSMLRFYQPEFIVLRYCEYKDSPSESWIDDNYRIIRSFEVPYDRNNPVFHDGNVDTGFFVLARRTWHPGATEYAGERLGIDPSHARALNSRGFRRMKQGDFAEATTFLDRSMAAAPDFPDAHNTLGLVLCGQGNPTGALAQFRRAIELDPDHALAHNNLGTLLAGQGDYENAVKELCEAARSDVEYAEPQVSLGNLLASRGKFAEARTHFEAALRIEAANRDAAEGLRKVKAALGR
jgi:Flp pilus assembly protein TadD